jgi:ABC-type transporter MlaC component
MRRKNKTQRGGVEFFSRVSNLLTTAKDRSDSTFQTINSSRCSIIQDLDQKKNCLVENTYFSGDEKKNLLRLKEPGETDNDVLNKVKNEAMKSVNEDWNQMKEYDTMYKTGNPDGNAFKKLLISKLTKFTKNLTKEQRVEAHREFKESLYKLKLLNMSDTDRQIELNKFIKDTAEEDAITVATERVTKEKLLRNKCINPDGTPILNCTPMGMGGRSKRYRRRKASRRRKTNKRRY